MENPDLKEHALQFNMAVSALIELEAMRAANIERERNGLSPAYGESQIREIFDEYGLGYNNCIAKSRNFKHS